MKSSHNQFVPYAEGAETEAKHIPTSNKASIQRFGFSGEFMDSLLLDPLFKGEIDRLVEDLASKKARTELETFKKTVEEEAKKTGFEAGKQEAQKQMVEQCQTLSEVASQIVEEKTDLLKSHEALWLKALGHLMDRFLISNKREMIPAIEQWLSSALNQIPKKEGIRILVSAQTFESLNQMTSEIEKRGWTLVLDPSLSPDEIRLESSGGGMFFSPSEEKQKLDEILNRFAPTEQHA